MKMKMELKIGHIETVQRDLGLDIGTNAVSVKSVSLSR